LLEDNPVKENYFGSWFEELVEKIELKNKSLAEESENGQSEKVDK